MQTEGDFFFFYLRWKVAPPAFFHHSSDQNPFRLAADSHSAVLIVSSANVSKFIVFVNEEARTYIKNRLMIQVWFGPKQRRTDDDVRMPSTPTNDGLATFCKLHTCKSRVMFQVSHKVIKSCSVTTYGICWSDNNTPKNVFKSLIILQKVHLWILNGHFHL